MAQQQCTAAVQSRLYNRNVAWAAFSAASSAFRRTRAALSASPASSRELWQVRVNGVASSGRYAYNGYSPYGVGAYGSLGYNYAAAADLSFRCDVDARGYVRNVSVWRR